MSFMCKEVLLNVIPLYFLIFSKNLPYLGVTELIQIPFGLFCLVGFFHILAICACASMLGLSLPTTLYPLNLTREKMKVLKRGHHVK